ncbi:MAG: malate synthase A, partial [bacterium]
MTKNNLHTKGKLHSGYGEILTEEALSFISKLEETFGERRIELLNQRNEVQKKIDTGLFPDFPPDTVSIRKGQWKIAEIPADLRDRRVEITGPVERKMIINALNSG